MNLRIPGPTPCRKEILDAVSRQMMNYRGPEMGVLLRRIVERLRRYLDTDYEILLLTASGTGAMESAVVNLLSPGERVVGVSAGAFGERFCAITEACGASLRRIEVEWGRAADPDALRQVLREEKDCRVVLLTHNETSTAILHPLEELCRVVREETDALLVVDAISSLGAAPLPMKAWNVDVVITGSQKAWGVPPGLAMVFVAPRVWEATERATLPRFYLDWRRYRKAAEHRTFPFTPALSVLYGLDVSLGLMLEEGAEAVFARHASIAAHTRERLEAIGFPLFADPMFASPTVTAIDMPQGVEAGALADRLRTKHDTTLAGGQGKLAGKILRLGHLGWVTQAEMDQALDALQQALAELTTDVAASN